MKLFTKISEGATKLFHKMGQENHFYLEKLIILLGK